MLRISKQFHLSRGGWMSLAPSLCSLEFLMWWLLVANTSKWNHTRALDSTESNASMSPTLQDTPKCQVPKDKNPTFRSLVPFPSTMLSNAILISCNSSPSQFLLTKPITSRLPPSYPPLNLKNLNPNPTLPFFKTLNPIAPSLKHPYLSLSSPFRRLGILQICQNSLNSKDPVLKEGSSKLATGNGGQGRDWTTSILLFGLWGALMYYVFMLAPNQTPSRDMYFLEKLLNLKGDDGFVMNEVLVSVWYIMGLWPLVYTMLLLPSGRSSNSKIPVWPFLVLSCFAGAYALLPYFVIWKPPPPPVEEEELGRWPLNFMESKLTAGFLAAAGLGLITYAGLADGDVWREFYQYFRESKFIHATCLDFILLSTFAPFWVYNDMTARKWTEKGSWILPLTLIPFLGPALYLVLRPPLSALPVSVSSTANKGD